MVADIATSLQEQPRQLPAQTINALSAIPQHSLQTASGIYSVGEFRRTDLRLSMIRVIFLIHTRSACGG